MSEAVLEFQSVRFVYPSAAEPVLDGLDLALGRGWTGVVGPNGSGKSTLLGLAAGLLDPSAGRVIRPQVIVHCPQRTDEPPAQLEEMLTGWDAAACALAGKLNLPDDAPWRWQSLSGGEQKRCQIATALWQRPDLLCLDEPTNHIDAQAREMLLESLDAFDGIGLLVSHDRKLLDRLARQCLFCRPPEIALRSGNYSQASRQLRLEHQAAAQKHQELRKQQKQIRREQVRRREKASQSHSNRSKRRVGRKDHDAKARINAARVTGKDAQAGRQLKQLAGRAGHIDRRLQDLPVNKSRQIGMDLQGARSRRDLVVDLPPGKIPLGPGRVLRFGPLQVAPDDRVGLVGPNGSGKTTLLDRLLGFVKVRPERMIVLSQEIRLDQCRKVLDQVRALDGEKKGRLMTAVASLGSEPSRLLETDTPSPGEVRKLLLAMGLARDVELIVMDEPTNHLDLPSIEAVQTALGRCISAMVLVSHDWAFLEAIANRWWRIGPEGHLSQGDRVPG